MSFRMKTKSTKKTPKDVFPDKNKDQVYFYKGKYHYADETPTPITPKEKEEIIFDKQAQCWRIIKSG